jgi:hypothetical protein
MASGTNITSSRWVRWQNWHCVWLRSVTPSNQLTSGDSGFEPQADLCFCIFHARERSRKSDSFARTIYIFLNYSCTGLVLSQTAFFCPLFRTYCTNHFDPLMPDHNRRLAHLPCEVKAYKSSIHIAQCCSSSTTTAIYVCESFRDDGCTCLPECAFTRLYTDFNLESLVCT